MSGLQKCSYTFIVEYNEEEKRLNAIRNYDELIQYTSGIFRLSQDSFHFIYIDEDDDPISVSNQDDLNIALEFFQGSIPKLSIKLNSLFKSNNSQIKPIIEDDILAKIKSCDDSQYEDDFNEMQFKEPENNFLPFEENKSNKIDTNVEYIENSEDEKISELYQENYNLDQMANENQLIDWPNDYDDSCIIDYIDSIIHDGYQCALCNNTPIYGVRYCCFVCDDFTLCDECELNEGHNHPLIKFKTNQDETKFFEDLKVKYFQDDHEEEVKLFTPKVIDSSLYPPKYLAEIPEYAKITSDFAKFKSTLVDMMPRTNYTIDQTTTSILLTITLKNSGIEEWPSGFYVGLLHTDNEILEQKESDDRLIKYNPEINKCVKPNSTVEMNVQLFPPSFAGTFTYTLSLHTLSKIPFGDEIDFAFTVKNVGYPTSQLYPVKGVKPAYRQMQMDRPHFLRRVNQEFKKGKCKIKGALKNAISFSDVNKNNYI